MKNRTEVLYCCIWTLDYCHIEQKPPLRLDSITLNLFFIINISILKLHKIKYLGQLTPHSLKQFNLKFSFFKLPKVNKLYRRYKFWVGNHPLQLLNKAYELKFCYDIDVRLLLTIAVTRMSLELEIIFFNIELLSYEVCKVVKLWNRLIHKFVQYYI